MKILWICNIPLPIISEHLGSKTNPMGGWLTGILNELMSISNLSIIVCFPFNTRNFIHAVINKNLQYYAFSNKRNTYSQIIEIFEKEQPDIIHIFGTEFKHTLYSVQAAQTIGKRNNVVISIQGLVSRYAEHFFAKLPMKNVLSWTPRDIVRFDNIFMARNNFIKRGKDEILAIKNVRYVIGRTDWDEACALSINPNVRYFHCNEILRSSFYETQWSYERCTPYSIFVSQCSYPIKGFHLLLKVLPDIIKIYPNAHVYVTGKNPSTIGYKKSSYAKYLETLIEQNNLGNYVTFLGTLNEQEMLEEYLKANIFCSCSSIENSPNSLGEAMMLGVPIVSSDVGGVKNMMTHGIDGYTYPYDEEYMIPYYVSKLFHYDDSVANFSTNARKHAVSIFDRRKNIARLLEIYDKILKAN